MTRFDDFRSVCHSDAERGGGICDYEGLASSAGIPAELFRSVRKSMKIDWFVKTLLFAIAVFLGVIAVRPLLMPPPVNAQSQEGYPFYIEPGVLSLRAPDGSRQVYGRMVVDLRNGKVWGFPTFTQDPYPVDMMNSAPPTSRPFLLAKFAFSDTEK
jgi:hypothetical protein